MEYLEELKRICVRERPLGKKHGDEKWQLLALCNPIRHRLETEWAENLGAGLRGVVAGLEAHWAVRDDWKA